MVNEIHITYCFSHIDGHVKLVLMFQSLSTKKHQRWHHTFLNGCKLTNIMLNARAWYDSSIWLFEIICVSVRTRYQILILYYYKIAFCRTTLLEWINWWGYITYYKNVFSSLVRETHEFRLMEGLNGKHTLLARMCKSIGGKQISWYG